MRSDHLSAEQRLDELEWRLSRYLAHLEESLDHDRRFQMQATWGIVNTAVGMSAFFGVLWAANHWLHMTGWILGTIATIGALVAWGAALAWSDKGRLGDLEKLSRLPKWDAHDQG